MNFRRIDVIYASFISLFRFLLTLLLYPLMLCVDVICSLDSSLSIRLNAQPIRLLYTVPLVTHGVTTFSFVVYWRAFPIIIILNVLCFPVVSSNLATPPKSSPCRCRHRYLFFIVQFKEKSKWPWVVQSVRLSGAMRRSDILEANDQPGINCEF